MTAAAWRETLCPFFLILNPVVRLLVIGVPVAWFGWWGMVGVLVVTSAIAVFRSYRSLIGVQQELEKLLSDLETDQRVTETVAAISARARQPVPRAGVVSTLDGSEFQAEAFKRPRPGFVFITRPLLRRLTDEELCAVLAHELAHIWHPMKGRQAILTVWGLCVGGAIELGYAVALFGPHLRAGRFLYSLWLLVLLLVLGRFVSVLVPAALSRHAESQADEWACHLGCDGPCLATALWELEARDEHGRVLANEGEMAPQLLRRMRKILRSRSRRRSWTAARRRDALMRLCRCDTVAEDLLSRLLSDHPSTARLTRRMLAEPPQPPTEAALAEESAPPAHRAAAIEGP
jgi:heat shock protein HtpX